jgi:hypothetical protein
MAASRSTRRHASADRSPGPRFEVRPTPSEVVQRAVRQVTDHRDDVRHRRVDQRNELSDRLTSSQPGQGERGPTAMAYPSRREPGRSCVGCIQTSYGRVPVPPTRALLAAFGQGATERWPMRCCGVGPTALVDQGHTTYGVGPTGSGGTPGWAWRIVVTESRKVGGSVADRRVVPGTDPADSMLLAPSDSV